MSDQRSAIEQRRVRFATIEGLTRDDLPLAGEVWLDDVIKAPWSSREAMKVASQLVKYMAKADASYLSLREMDRDCQLHREDVQRALTLMRTFMAIDAFTLDKDEVRAALNLSLIQRLRVLEARKRLLELAAEREQVPVRLPVREPRWAPPPRPSIDELEEKAIPSLVALISEHIRTSAGKLEAVSPAA